MNICWGWWLRHHPRWASKQCTSSTPNGFRSTPRCPAHPSTEKWMRSLKDTWMHGQKGWSADAQSGSIGCTLTILAQTKASWSSSAAKYQRMGRSLQGPCSGIASSKHHSSMLVSALPAALQGPTRMLQMPWRQVVGLERIPITSWSQGPKRNNFRGKYLKERAHRMNEEHFEGSAKMSERMSDRTSNYLPERISDIVRWKDRINMPYTSRWYVRNYVRIVVQGGDHSKKVILFCLCSLLGGGAHVIFSEEASLIFCCLEGEWCKPVL